MLQIIKSKREEGDCEIDFCEKNTNIRSMFKKVVESLEKANVRAKLKSGELMCPDCGAPAGKLPKNWDEVMACGACGARASLNEWANASDPERRIGFADRPPVGTKIRRETIAPDHVIWHIPAVGKFGFFLFFAIFWLLITGLVSGGFLLAILSGGEIEGNMPEWLLIPFFGIFWAVGLGMLYAAFRQKYMKHTVTFGNGNVTLRRELFGKTREKSLLKTSVSSIVQKEFYQQNYKPIYGIEIRGSDGKLRFGSALTAEEKAWLVADFRKVLEGDKVPESIATSGAASGGLAPMQVGQRKSVFSVTIPKPGVSALIGSLIFAIFGIGFVCAGIFLIEGESSPADSESGGWLPFLMANGFRTFWIMFSSIFVFAGLGMSYSTLKGMRKDRRIEGNEAEISLRTYRNGLVMEDRSFPRSQVFDIRATQSGSSNGNAMKRVELIIGDKTEKIASWMDGDAADQLVEEVRAALGR